MNKKIKIFSILLPFLTLSGCNKDLLESLPNDEVIQPGEIPSGGQEATFEDVSNTLKDSLNNFNAHNGLSIQVKDSNFSYIEDYFEYNYDNLDSSGNPTKWQYKETTKISNANASLKVTGLKNANSIKDLKGGLEVNADFDYTEFDSREPSNTKYNETGQKISGSMYYNDGKAYITANDFTDMFLGTEKNPNEYFVNLFYDDMDSEFTETTGLTLPLLSDSNIDYLQSLVKNFDYDKNLGISEATIDGFLETVVSKFFIINKYGNDFLLSLSITKDNLLPTITSTLDELYNKGYLSTILHEQLSPTDYQEIKNDFTNNINEFILNTFNYAKMSITFNSSFIKSISANFDFGYNEYGKEYDDNGTLLGKSWESFMKVKGNVNLLFEYSDNVNVSFPDLSNYVDLDEYNGIIFESTANLINEAAEADDHWSYDEVIDKLGKPTQESVISGNGLAIWYNGYDSIEEAMEAYEDGETVKAIMVTFINGKATSAEYEEGNKYDE